MSNITGRAKKFDGTAINYVMLYDWDLGYSIARIKPNAAGVWNHRIYKDARLGIAYVANGCEPITHGPYDFVAAWSPYNLFEGGGRGVFYDPSDLSTIFQDANGVVPVTAHGQPVGLMKDLSGNNYHARQSALNSRPLYQTDGVRHWLSFDGVDDHLVADYQLVSPKHLMGVGVHLLSTNTQKGIFECFGDTDTNTANYKKGSRILYYGGSFRHQLGDGTNRYTTSQTYINSPLTLIASVDNSQVSFWTDASEINTTHANSMVAGGKTYIGNNDNLEWAAKMRFYGAVVLERNTTSDEFTKIRNYLASAIGSTNI